MGEPKKAFVERLFLRHRDALQTFFYRRIRTKADAADLAQEVYLRMLRVNDTDDILNPAAYLYAVAGNLLRENAAKDRRQADGIKVEDDDSAQQLSELPSGATSWARAGASNGCGRCSSSCRQNAAPQWFSGIDTS